MSSDSDRRNFVACQNQGGVTWLVGLRQNRQLGVAEQYTLRFLSPSANSDFCRTSSSAVSRGAWNGFRSPADFDVALWALVPVELFWAIWLATVVTGATACRGPICTVVTLDHHAAALLACGVFSVAGLAALIPTTRWILQVQRPRGDRTSHRHGRRWCFAARHSGPHDRCINPPDHSGDLRPCFHRDV